MDIESFALLKHRYVQKTECQLNYIPLLPKERSGDIYVYFFLQTLTNLQTLNLKKKYVLWCDIKDVSYYETVFTTK